MKLKPKELLISIGAIVVFAVAGFLREKFFYEINARIKFLQGEANRDYNDYNYDFLFTEMSIAELTVEKWWWTGAFTLLYFTLSFVTIKILNLSDQLLRGLILLYGVLIVIALGFYFAGNMFGFEDMGYRISRVFMGFVQSPIPILILILI